MPILESSAQGLPESLSQLSGPKIWEQLQFLLRYQNAKSYITSQRTPLGVVSKLYFLFFYELLFSISKASVLIDSSKTWDGCCCSKQIQLPQDLRHFLNATYLPVANSWKKEVRLPEFEDGNTFMPQKSNWEIPQSALQNKQPFQVRFKIPVSRESLMDSLLLTPRDVAKLEALLGITLHDRAQPNYAIGGNPMLFGWNPTPQSFPKPNRRYENLSLMDRLFFAFATF